MSVDSAIRLVASGRSLNEALGALGLRTLPSLSLQGRFSQGFDEQWLKLVSMDPSKNEIVMNIQGTNYTYIVPKDVYDKFNKMWNVYGAGGKALNWMKTQPGVSFRKAQ